MKNILIILFYLCFTNSYSQEAKTIYLSSDFIRLNVTNQTYSVHFTINRQDQNRKWDVYKFFVADAESFDGPKNLKKLGVEIDAEKEIEIKNEDYFKGRDFCDIHNELSSAKIFIIKKIPASNTTYKYKLWQVYYDGTVMNLSIINSDTFENQISKNPKRKL